MNDSYGQHHRDDDKESADQFWARDIAWGAEYERPVYPCYAHEQGRYAQQVTPTQIAAVLHPSSLRRALIIRTERRVSA